MTNPVPHVTKAAPAVKVRDPRLDFFRGIAMFIIFVAHTPRDFWALWIPARFGFSDATEIFVFCSGMASALAFGVVFQKRGWWMGLARIAHRIWQVYWAHIGLFFAVLLLITAFDQIGTLTGPTFKGSHVEALNLQHFYSKTPDLMLGLFTLTYVPNYFDILPMYLVILAMVPVVMGLARIHLGLVAAFVISLWLLANLQLVGLSPFNFPAEPWSNREWFFNPMGWQLVFFTGFAFMRGWLPQPPVSRGLVIAAIAILLITVPFAYFRILREVPMLHEASQALKPLTEKSSFGILRYVHFLALAYVSWVAVGPMGSRLSNWGHFGIIVDVIRKVGQQSLAVFISSLIVAQFVGMIFRVYGTDWFLTLLGNFGGFAALIAVAYTVAWFKSQPWQKPATPTSQSAAHHRMDSGVGLPSGSHTLPSGSYADKSL